MELARLDDLCTGLQQAAPARPVEQLAPDNDDGGQDNADNAPVQEVYDLDDHGDIVEEHVAEVVAQDDNDSDDDVSGPKVVILRTVSIVSSPSHNINPLILVSEPTSRRNVPCRHLAGATLCCRPSNSDAPPRTRRR